MGDEIQDKSPPLVGMLMQLQDTTAEQDAQLGLVAAAETAAWNGDGSGSLHVLSKVGSWTVDPAFASGD
jgi:hypothetical protein